ncbi:hypothetical protein FEO95_05280 [Stenotrophomonas maltophilia]|nr:hypothetical protein FEO95_05280 [Stenotrophomonas maltophilia]
MCYEENATGHYCTLTGQGELAIAAGEGHSVPYSVLLGSAPFSVGKGSDPIRFSMPDRDSSTHGVDLLCRPRSTPTNSTRNLSEAGRCGSAGPLAPWAQGMPRTGWAGRPTPVLLCAQDSAHEQGAIEPPGVRALCLRSTASQAPERTAASGWAGPRSGVYGVSCRPTPPRHPT